MKDAKVANKVRESLCPTYITKERGKTAKGGTTDFYRITDEGKAYLLRLSQYPSTIQVSGLAINRLLDMARNQAPTDGRPAPQPSAVAEPAQPTADLPGEIVRAFEELRRERYGLTGLVPIHEVRRAVAERLGDEAARHERFDVAVNTLRLDNRLRMVPINDASRTTPEQLADSIPGSNVTWFYLEAVS